ncbi:MAG: hypothetical protein KF819_15920 [Labilithrix sp.]|nr:hypothetical protein [Labilithrix sp.]
MARARLAFIGLASALLVVACGKVGGDAPLAGVYMLERSPAPTRLELRGDGTFTLHRTIVHSSDLFAHGEWRTDGATRLVRRDVRYWPTPDTFPSSVVATLTLRPRGEDLVVTGESEWAGTFDQRWRRQRGATP